jgi:hypothetical protein
VGVERSVVGQAQHGVAVMVEHLAHFDRHLVADHLLGHPAADGVDSEEYAAVVVDVGILGDRAIGVAGVDRVNVFGDDPRQVDLFHAFRVPISGRRRCCSR